MWYECENGNDTRPDDIDTLSSRIYVYLRRNITLIEEQEERPAHYCWQEKKILKEIWPLYEEQMHNAANIDYIAMMSDIDLGDE